MRGFILTLVGLSWVALPVAAWSAPLSCLKDFELAKRRVPVGVETIHRTSETAITIFLPLPQGERGYLENLNSLGYDDKYPERFTFSDGSLGTAFIDVDMREDSRLRTCVRELSERFRALGRSADPAARLVHFLDDYLDPVPTGFKFPWEAARGPALPPEFRRAGDLPVGHFPLATSLLHTEVPLEAFLKAKRGVCVQRVLLLSLVMKELGLRHRVRAGGIEVHGDGSGGGGGHVWIELPDRRHLDPTWHLLEKPSENSGDGWFHIDRSDLFRNQVFPITVNG